MPVIRPSISWIFPSNFHVCGSDFLRTPGTGDSIRESRIARPIVLDVFGVQSFLSQRCFMHWRVGVDEQLSYFILG